MLLLAAIPWIESIPFWILLAGGLILIGVDICIANSQYLMWVGIGVIAASLASAAKLPGEIQVVVFVGTLVCSAIYARKWIAALPRNQPRASSATDLRDAVGTVLHDAESVEGEGRAFIQDHGEWRIRPHQATVRFSPGDRVRVVEREGLILLVEPTAK